MWGLTVSVAPFMIVMRRILAQLEQQAGVEAAQSADNHNRIAFLRQKSNGYKAEIARLEVSWAGA